MSNKELYRKFCEQENNLPLFLQYEWLNGILKNDEWDIILEQRGGEIVAVMPVYFRKAAFLRIITQPLLTPYLGIWLKYPENQKQVTKLSYEIEISEALIDKLPKADGFNVKFYPTFNNWLPFYWKGFSQTTQYTYVINHDQTFENIYNEFKESNRREIKKAEKSLHVETGIDERVIFNLYVSAFKHKKEKIVIHENYFNAVCNTIKRLNGGIQLNAIDDNGNIHASCLFVWDSLYCYYLFGAAAPEYKTSGALSLLMWEGIQLAKSRHVDFNFEGSMIKPVERFFRNFGGIQMPYFRIYKSNSALLKLKELF